MSDRCQKRGNPTPEFPSLYYGFSGLPCTQGTFTKSILTMFEVMFANWAPPCRLLTENVSEWPLGRERYGITVPKIPTERQFELFAQWKLAGVYAYQSR